MLRYVSELKLKKSTRPGDKRKAMNWNTSKGTRENKGGRQEGLSMRSHISKRHIILKSLVYIKYFMTTALVFT